MTSAVEPHPDSLPRETLFGGIVQFAYHAPVIEIAASAWAQERGAGPFFLLEHIELTRCRYRGQSSRFDHSSAYGQYGDVMIELIHQHDDAPSPVRDMYDAATPGLHHAAVFVDDLEAALVKAAASDMPCVLDASTQEGVRFAMVDARASLGFMVEIYEPGDALKKFYAYVARKAEGWNGDAPLRRLS